MTVLIGDCVDRLSDLSDGSVHTCVTSPPYFGLRDYGHDGQIGLEDTLDAYVEKLVGVFREVRRVLRGDGTLWLNLGDSYAANRSYQVSDQKHRSHDFGRSNANRCPDGLKPKDLIGIPWRVAFALQADGWWLRQDIIWHKPNQMPESVRDRCTKAHEYIFLLSKSARYYYDAGAIAEPAVGRPTGSTRNRRSVWTVSTQPFGDAHFATFPVALIEPCILAGAPLGGVVLDPFFGAGTTGVAAVKHGRRYVGIEINPEYAEMAIHRIDNTTPHQQKN